MSRLRRTCSFLGKEPFRVFPYNATGSRIESISDYPANERDPFYEIDGSSLARLRNEPKPDSLVDFNEHFPRNLVDERLGQALSYMDSGALRNVFQGITNETGNDEGPYSVRLQVVTCNSGNRG